MDYYLNQIAKRLVLDRNARCSIQVGSSIFRCTEINCAILSSHTNMFMYSIPEEQDQASVDERRMTAHRLVLNNLPSREMSGVIQANISNQMGRRMSAVESYKLRRSSSLSRRISSVDVGVLCEVLVNQKQSRETTLQYLKAMNARLEIKKKIKYRVLKDKFPPKRLRVWDSLGADRFKMAMQNLKFGANLLKSMQLWHGHLQTIRRNFGSEVASFFIFLRWLLYLNLLNLLVTVCFIVIPQSTPVIDKHNGSDVQEIFQLENLLTGEWLRVPHLNPQLYAQLPANLAVCECSEIISPISDALRSQLRHNGWLGRTLFFYGQYTNGTVEKYGMEFDMPLVYVLTICAIGLLNLALITKRLSSVYFQSYLVTSKLKRGFCANLFCSWDYNITTEDAAYFRKHSIHQELKAILSIKKTKSVKQAAIQTWIRNIYFIFGNLFALVLIAGAGMLVYYILMIKAVRVTIPFLSLITLPVTVTLILLTLHYALSILFRFENFNSTTETRLYYTVMRIALMRCSILGMLSYFWMYLHMPETGDVHCYENLQGQEIYRLILFNFLMTSFVYSVVMYLWKKLRPIAYVFGYELAPLEFNISFWTINLIYYQTLTWVGLLYSPLLPILTIVVYFFIFHSTLNFLKDNCKPSSTFISTMESRIVYLSVTLMCFILSAISVTYSLFYAKPSELCGPFTNQPTVFTIVYIWWLQINKKYLLLVNVLDTLWSCPLLVTLFTVLCVAIHFARAYANAQEQALHHIEHLLSIEGQDKAFLLKLYEKELLEPQKERKNK